MRLPTGSALIFAIIVSACTNHQYTGDTMNNTPTRPTGSQDPGLPHPGTIEAKYTWNNSIEYWKSAELPDSFIFRCFDKNGKSAPRDQAAWCIPVVEIVTISVDKSGKPVPPKGAASVEIAIYGPNHRFLEHVSKAPPPPPPSPAN